MTKKANEAPKPANDAAATTPKEPMPGNFDKRDLQNYVDRLEKLALEKKEISECEKDVFTEATNRGLNKKALKEILRLRKMDVQERDELRLDVHIYARALGMQYELFDKAV